MLKNIKLEARKLQAESQHSYVQALNIVAKKYGYKSYNALLASKDKEDFSDESWFNLPGNMMRSNPSYVFIGDGSIPQYEDVMENLSISELKERILGLFPYSEEKLTYTLPQLSDDRDLTQLRENVESNMTLHTIEKWAIKNSSITSGVCGCMGPESGMPACPCRMRNILNMNGAWVYVFLDAGRISFYSVGDYGFAGTRLFDIVNGKHGLMLNKA